MRAIRHDTHLNLRVANTLPVQFQFQAWLCQLMLIWSLLQYPPTTASSKRPNPCRQIHPLCYCVTLPTRLPSLAAYPSASHLQACWPIGYRSLHETSPTISHLSCTLSLDHIARRDLTKLFCCCWVESGRAMCTIKTQRNKTVLLSWVSWVASGDVITLKTQPDSFWSNFRPVGVSRRVLNISELVETSRRQSGDVITFTTRKN